MSRISNWFKVHMRSKDPHAPVFVVFKGAGGWLYHQERGGNIANNSEAYWSKGNAKRAAYAQAAMIPGATVRVVTDQGVTDL